MANMPYGGFMPAPEGHDDEPWTKLATIGEHLEAGEALPPHLAQWLGFAIQHANGDTDELLRRLGIGKARPGNPGRWTDEHAYRLGQAVCQHEDKGVKPEKAISEVLDEYSALNDGEAPSRQMLQRWRNQYREASEEANRP